MTHDEYDQESIPTLAEVDEFPPNFKSEAKKREVRANCDHPEDRLARDPTGPMPGGAIFCLDCGDIL